MAIIIANDGDITVASIAARNAIVKRFDGMQVRVTDATGDVDLGGGQALYQWDAVGGRWLLLWSDHKETVSIAHEKKVLVGGIVTADNVPSQGVVWSARIVDSNGVIQRDVTPTVNVSTIEIYTTEFDGMFLEYTYAYGTIGSQLELVIDNIENSLNQKLSKSGGTITGHIVPSNENVDLGSPTEPFRHVYVSANSLYIDGEQVISREVSGDIRLGNETTRVVVTGDSETAGRLKTPITINGVEFDGSENIVVGLGDGTGVVSQGGFDTYKDGLLVNNLESDSTTQALTAAQGKALKGLVDNINTLLTADDTTLDELQEIVDYIKLNRSTLESLSTASIAGLETALAGKVDAIVGKQLSTEDYTTTEKGKLAGIAAGAQVNVGTDLGIDGTGDTRTITSSTGTDVTIPIATASLAGVMSRAMVTKLNAAGTNANGARTVSTGNPAGGVDNDIWLKY